jgi:hypothetical protein
MEIDRNEREMDLSSEVEVLYRKVNGWIINRCLSKKKAQF